MSVHLPSISSVPMTPVLHKTRSRSLGRVIIQRQVAGLGPNRRQVIKMIGISLEREVLCCTCHPSLKTIHCTATELDTPLRLHKFLQADEAHHHLQLWDQPPTAGSKTGVFQPRCSCRASSYTTSGQLSLKDQGWDIQSWGGVLDSWSALPHDLNFTP